MSFFLEAQTEGRSSWRAEITPLPFRVGRRDTSHLRLVSPSISGEHAVLDASENSGLTIEDLGSTNGTFVNLNRVEGRVELSVGDVVHFADQEFRLLGPETSAVRRTAAVNPEVLDAMRGLVERRTALEESISAKSFQVLFQPILGLRDGESFGYEALARAGIDAFLDTEEMFTEAQRLSMSLALSETLREVTAREVAHLDGGQQIFINTHPVELETPDRLLESIDRFRGEVPDHRLVVEIHEMAVSTVGDFMGLRAALEERAVGLAFDDFGRGQSRFLELAELRPEFVKFDRATIAGAREMGDSKAQMIGTLVEMVHSMGQSALAEGIETDEELDFCRELGFDYGQGYLLGRPRPADEPPTDDGILRAKFERR